MSHRNFEPLAAEALTTFAEISEGATQKLATSVNISADSFASGNTLTGAQAYQNLNDIGQINREAWRELSGEPSIARLVLKAESGQELVIYITRNISINLASNKQVASYKSAIGRLAELPVGEDASIVLQGRPQVFSVIEKTSFRPGMTDNGWDSLDSQYRHVDLGVFSIDSLRSLLIARGIDAVDELDKLLEKAATENGVRAGISHQVRTAMGLRDQPILDQFQGEIFRLPLDSQLIILGPPGTGKTTTLIKRLGQKLDISNLDENERHVADVSGQNKPHASSWLMFTPSELLKHYLKEAFSREQVPASDEHIKTWTAYRSDIARNTLGILRTANGGKYTFKPEMQNLAPAVTLDPRGWYQAFSNFHDNRLKIQLKEGATIVLESAPATGKEIAQELQRLVKRLDGRVWVDIYRDLDKQEIRLKVSLDESKEITDQLLKQERNRIFNGDKEVFHRLALFLESIQQDDDEADEDAEFDEDDSETSVSSSTGDIQNAVRVYLASLRALARSRYRKRSLPKDSRAAKIVPWLGSALPPEAVLLEIGQRTSFQNGLRRFINAFRRYVTDVSSSYRLFRKETSDFKEFYCEAASNPSHLSVMELDAIVLLMLRNCRALLSQSFIDRELDAPRFEILRNLARLFRNQIMVDEATDFSMLELACMESMTTLKGRSFFACGDFNQRITHTGVRTMEQIDWVSARISAKSINLVYRQSRALNTFAGDLLRILDGDLSALGSLPKESTHEGVKPVLLERASEDEAAAWVAQRIAEVERAVKKMPTIAVLVNKEDDVKPMAERLTGYLETVNLKAVACEEGKALGEGTDVRVFSVQHIKGLEFEAVFFVGIDRCAEQNPKLFDRYLYVGATRAATYLGMVCYHGLPLKMKSLADSFDKKW
ncbi:ATP-binding domain-containing protein [Janthinobacterium sp. SUN206]|uniref:ATP-binding domain-containing protein n=1 Tax=Janthinobacterium sp. SUN206 TaxID=3014787 RepID=UPI002712D7A2|nr:ATP-binding domain-containing protein [Janthinobacterium sp. SUN206]MDO8069250.1 ATP-binding domain-containing protein [Janthinobacterium sp. SUN206]